MDSYLAQNSKPQVKFGRQSRVDSGISHASIPEEQKENLPTIEQVVLGADDLEFV